MQSTESEVWKPVPGWEGLYDVSSAGRVRSIRAGKVLRQSLAGGYYRVTLQRRGLRIMRSVHHLVLETFIEPRPDGLVGCHNDGDALNNRVTNLRWDTASANARDRVRHHHHMNAEKTHCVRGHAFTEANTYIRSGARSCRECRARASVESRARHPRPVGVGRGGVNAQKKTCAHGHEFDDANTYVTKTGSRDCRACARARAERRRQQN